MTQLSESYVRAIIRRIDDGECQSTVLREESIPYKLWRMALAEHGIQRHKKRGRKVVTYAPEVLMTVQRRARAGEFIQDICDDLGLLYPNLCRACRRAGIRILDEESLRANIRRRNLSGPKRKPGEPPKSPHIFAALEAGASVGELVERFQITHSYAKLCRKRHREGTWKAVQERHRERQQRRAQIWDLRAQGMSISDIAERYAISPQYVSALLRKYPAHKDAP